ncbi:scarecrow-like protein 9 [Phalaenopsis equestris]|uniref:scarecrow-like protein 9 n=1 Tax=Phalaenopsis equestris TaxID=78828 RepID=UPI0009E43997|nr:scarecrow-like protein 9 [Phalaenopsis equestris]
MKGNPRKSSQIFSDEVLDYIKQLFMEEDVDVLQSHPELEATEKPFYELIGEKYPPSPDRSPPESSGENRSCNTISDGIDFFQSNSEFAWYRNCDISPSHPSLGLQEDQFTNLFFRYLPTSEFHKGVEEAKKFLPNENNLAIHHFAQADLTLQREPIEGARRKQNRSSDEWTNEEARRSKQSASFSEEPTVPSEILDELLLCSGDKFPKIVKAIRKDFYKEASLNSQNTEPKELGTRRKSSKTKQPKKTEDAEEADIQTLLLLCAQTAANYDSRRAYELLKQIRQHSSPHGDASQRLAHYFADGLEARLSGTGSELHHSVAFNQKTLKDALSAYKLYLASCPFKKISYHFANQTILDTIQNADRVHILDFGIYFGFQWPVFLKLLSLRSGGPPKLRITGIDIPQPGFRPTKMIEETGRRLTDYAERFGVPFEYHGIAAKFDEINVEELSIDEEEMLVANCLFRLHSPADETVFEECPRDKVLNTIRKLNPAVFVNVVLNGTYGAPLFMTRVREALYHFSAVFDMIDATTIRESETRLMVERDLYGRLLINAISCEGLERERPETYRQWQVRCLRAGFGMAPNSRRFVKKVKDGVRSIYHEDFCIDEDDRWLLVGWKGRILYALSAWKPS